MKENEEQSVYLSIVKTAHSAPYAFACLETKGLDIRTVQIVEIAALQMGTSSAMTGSY